MMLCARHPVQGGIPPGRGPFWPPWVGPGLAALALAGPALAADPGGDGAGVAGRPNLILVLVDTLRADHVGYHGYARQTSPNLDALAQRSVRFMNHYAHSSRTSTSVASLWTGLHPPSHGVLNPLDRFNAIGKLAQDQTTLAEILSRQGYSCLAIVTNPNLNPRFGYAQGFSTYEFMPRGADIRPTKYRARRPFFFYLHYMQPHSPYNPPAHLRGLWADPAYAGPITGDHRQLDAILTGRLRVNAADRQRITTLYDQEIRHFDEHLGELLLMLEAGDLLRDTVLVVVADHGEELFDHGGLLHGYTLYDEQLHVPLLIHDPRRPRSAQVLDQTRNVDLLPTLLELLGVRHGGPLQGRSLVPLLAGRRRAPPAAPLPLYSQGQLHAVKKVKLRSLEQGGWQLVQHLLPGPAPELYHVATDRHQQRNLYRQRPEQARAMEQAMKAFLERLPHAREGAVQLKAPEREKLKSLGYVR